MPWRIEGKIGCHFPDRGQPNLDTDNIIFCPNGSTANSAQIEKVYYIPAGVTNITVNDLPQYGIWRRYWEEPPAELQLVRGSDGVLIEYIPDRDITLNSFGIFEDNGNTSYTNDNFRIFNEAGVQLAFLGSGTIISNEVVKYGLTGHIRTGNMGTVQLKAGKKYYFLFQTDSWQSSNATPAMFNNEEGIVRQTYNQQSDTLTGVVDDSTWNSYIAGNTNIQLFENFVNANQNDYMVWTYSDMYGLNQNKLYLRNNYYNNLNYPFVDNVSNNSDICNLDNNTLFWYTNTLKQRNTTLTASAFSGTLVLNQILQLNKNDWFIYGAEYNTGLTVGDVYRCDFNNISTFNTSQNDFALQLADLLKNIPNSGDEIFCTDAKPSYSCFNHIITNTGYISCINTLTPLTSDPATGYTESGVYLLGAGTYSYIGQIYNTGVYFYSNNNLTVIHDQNMNTIISIDSVANKCTHYNYSDLYKDYGDMTNFYSTTAESQTAFLNTTYGNARYYLEINGQEVNTPS